MKFTAAILNEQKKPLLVDEIAIINKLETGQVLVKVNFSGICGSQIGEIEGVKGHEECIILTVMSENAKKVCKKLRLRNYPSIALFINGDKIDTWKGDMDGVIEVEPSDIKDAIEEALAGEQY